MPFHLAAITFLFTLGIRLNLASAAHAGFHVQFPWLTRGPNPKARPEIDHYSPFCSMLPSVPGLAAA